MTAVGVIKDDPCFRKHAMWLVIMVGVLIVAWSLLMAEAKATDARLDKVETAKELQQYQYAEITKSLNEIKSDLRAMNHKVERVLGKDGLATTQK